LRELATARDEAQAAVDLEVIRLGHAPARHWCRLPKRSISAGRAPASATGNRAIDESSLRSLYRRTEVAIAGRLPMCWSGAGRVEILVVGFRDMEI